MRVAFDASSVRVSTMCTLGLLLGILSSQTPVFGLPGTPCTDSEVAIAGDIHVMQVCNEGAPVAIRLSPDSTDESGSWRSFTFGDQGSFQVVNTYPPREGEADTLSNTNAVRAFFLFPRTGRLSYEIHEGSVRVQSASGLAVTFDPTTRLITGAEGATLTEDPSVNRGNRGGVEISSYEGIVLDTGFGRSPGFENSRGTSTFRDREGRSCSVRNSEIFEYEYVEYEHAGHMRRSLVDARLKFETDLELAEFLGGRSGCRSLNVSSLVPTVPPTTPSLDGSAALKSSDADETARTATITVSPSQDSQEIQRGE